MPLLNLPSAATFSKHHAADFFFYLPRLGYTNKKAGTEGRLFASIQIDIGL
jgi:hypothetical protein